jgi:hypothetical protein
MENNGPDFSSATSEWNAVVFVILQYFFDGPNPRQVLTHAQKYKIFLTYTNE